MIELTKKDKILSTLRSCLRERNNDLHYSDAVEKRNLQEDVESLRDTILFIESKFQGE